MFAGHIAQRFGIEHTLTMAFIGLALGVIVSLCLVETAPRRVAKSSLAGERLLRD